MRTDAYRIHARQARCTVSREAAAVRFRWALALVFSLIATVLLGTLTFSALAANLDTGVALAYALVLHTVAILAAHVFFHRDDGARLVGGAVAALCAVIAFGIAMNRGLTWFEGSVAVAFLVALLEPLGIALTGWITGAAHRAMDNANFLRRRAYELVDAVRHNHRPARVWATHVQQNRDELARLSEAPDDFDEREQARRDAKAALVERWVNLLESHATAQHALVDDAGEHGFDPIIHAALPQPPRPVPVQPHVVPDELEQDDVPAADGTYGPR